MKKFLCGVLSVSAMAAFAVDATVATVDVTRVTSAFSNTVVAVSALDLATGGDLAISNLVKTAGLTAGDRLLKFSDGSNYECWTLSADGVWEPTPKYVAGQVDPQTPDPAALVTEAVGSGIWLSRQDTSKPFVIYGLHSDTKTSVVPAGSSAALVGNPTQVDKAPSVVGAQDGDRIVVQDASTVVKKKEYIYKGGAWKHWVGINLQEGLPTVKAGTGFWYVPKNAQQVTINW